MSPRRATVHVSPDRILEGHTPEIQATTERLRGVIREVLPDLDEVGYPGWHAIGLRHARGGRVCAIFPFEDVVQLVFERGAQLQDPERRLLGETKQTRHLEYRCADDVDPDVLAGFLLEASSLRP